MADIEKQLLTRVRMKQSCKITLLLDDSNNFITKVDRVIGREKIDRRFLSIKNINDEKILFECGPKLAENIIIAVDKYIEKFNENKPREVEIEIIKDCVNVISPEPKQIGKIRKFFNKLFGK
jgi:hypothetical protein